MSGDARRLPDYLGHLAQAIAYRADPPRFHALRLRDVAMIKSTPRKLIVQGTDWRFLNDRRRK